MTFVLLQVEFDMGRDLHARLKSRWEYRNVCLSAMRILKLYSAIIVKQNRTEKQR